MKSNPLALAPRFTIVDLTINKKPVASVAPLITWNVPRALAKAWLVQVQAGQKS